MTVAFAALREIVVGRQPAGDALLQNCRLEGFGARVFGREPILDLFRRFPIALPEAVDPPESPRALLAIHQDRAVFADLHDGRIARLWVLGPDRAGAPEPEVCVPRDLDLTQFEGDAVFDPADHPDLASAGGAALARIARSLARGEGETGNDLPTFSRRAFVIRAFSSGDQVAALIVLAGASDAARRKPVSFNAALVVKASADLRLPTLVLDRAGLELSHERPWTPRL